MDEILTYEPDLSLLLSIVQQRNTFKERYDEAPIALLLSDEVGISRQEGNFYMGTYIAEYGSSEGLWQDIPGLELVSYEEHLYSREIDRVKWSDLVNVSLRAKEDFLLYLNYLE